MNQKVSHVKQTSDKAAQLWFAVAVMQAVWQLGVRLLQTVIPRSLQDVQHGKGQPLMKKVVSTNTVPSCRIEHLALEICNCQFCAQAASVSVAFWKLLASKSVFTSACIFKSSLVSKELYCDSLVT